MDKKEILKHIDHTLLKAVATWEDIKVLCDEKWFIEALENRKLQDRILF